MSRKRIVLFSYSVFATIMLTIMMGCSETKFSEIQSKPISQYRLMQNNTSLSIAIDPFIEPERLKKYFQKDLLLDFNVVPIFVLVQNNGDEPIFLSNGECFLIGTDGSQIAQSSPVSVAGPIAREQITAAQSLAALSLISPLPVFIYAFSGAEKDNFAAVQNIINRALYDRILYRGESHQGFIYFLLKGKGYLKDVRGLKLHVKNPITEEVNALAFSLFLEREVSKNE